MKVLHVLDHSAPIISGYSSRTRSIVRFQERLGLEPVILTSPKHGAARDVVETIEGLRYYRTGVTGARPPFLAECHVMLKLAAQLARTVSLERPRLLHAHSPLLNGLPTLWVGRRRGLPVVYEARAFWEDAAVDHGTTRAGSFRYRLTRALESWVFRRADRVVTICEGMRHDITERGVPADRVAAIPNGVDVDWFQPRPRSAEVCRQFRLNGGPVFGFIGSFYRYEGLRFLVSAFGELRRRLPGARLLLVGGGEDEAVLRADASALHGAVIFAGQIPHAEIRDFYAAIDVFVCPRLRMRLTEVVTPLKPLEAMAMGQAVLASDVGGLKELIRDGVTGLLFPAESAGAFVEAAAHLGADADLRTTLGRQARAHAVAERRWETLVRRYLDVYRAAGAAA